MVIDFAVRSLVETALFRQPDTNASLHPPFECLGGEWTKNKQQDGAMMANARHGLPHAACATVVADSSHLRQVADVCMAIVCLCSTENQQRPD